MESFSWHLKKEKNSTHILMVRLVGLPSHAGENSPAFFAVSELAFSYVEELPLLP